MIGHLAAARLLLDFGDLSLTSITVAPGTDVKVDNQGSAPHTVTADDDTFDSGTVDGIVYYVMPYEPGLSLRQRLERDGPLPFGAFMQLALYLFDLYDEGTADVWSLWIGLLFFAAGLVLAAGGFFVGALLPSATSSGFGSG